MHQFREAVRNFAKREDGPTGVEYAVMLALIITVCVTTVMMLSESADSTFDLVGTKLETESR